MISFHTDLSQAHTNRCVTYRHERRQPIGGEDETRFFPKDCIHCLWSLRARIINAMFLLPYAALSLKNQKLRAGNARGPRIVANMCLRAMPVGRSEAVIKIK